MRTKCVSVSMTMSVCWVRAIALRVSHLGSVSPLTLNRSVLRGDGVGRDRTHWSVEGVSGGALGCWRGGRVFQTELDP